MIHFRNFKFHFVLKHQRFRPIVMSKTKTGMSKDNTPRDGGVAKCVNEWATEKIEKVEPRRPIIPQDHFENVCDMHPDISERSPRIAPTGHHYAQKHDKYDYVADHMDYKPNGICPGYVRGFKQPDDDKLWDKRKNFKKITHSKQIFPDDQTGRDGLEYVRKHEDRWARRRQPSISHYPHGQDAVREVIRHQSPRDQFIVEETTGGLSPRGGSDALRFRGGVLVQNSNRKHDAAFWQSSKFQEDHLTDIAHSPRTETPREPYVFPPHNILRPEPLPPPPPRDDNTCLYQWKEEPVTEATNVKGSDGKRRNYRYSEHQSGGRLINLLEQDARIKEEQKVITGPRPGAQPENANKDAFVPQDAPAGNWEVAKMNRPSRRFRPQESFNAPHNNKTPRR